ncbi:SAM-dependent methyltransferase [Desulfonema limicola]|uniref:SAM-dependent methyltransferase n=1 Tax=Desulfonema limicola TaxID=45656 RepID=A0A975B4M2_9BACT|nr:DUF6094 domain-containing protein [Desulfonema limicola]QTA78713.1 SAM-dependent methyltransferase [Desulfonema limicola]
MARLASQEKLGYYKTPENIVNQIKSCIRFDPGARILDPCCGKGEAVSILSADNPVETLGIELEKGRYEKAGQCLQHVLWADAISEATVSNRSIDLLFLNPPYDHDEGSDTQTGERFEYQFLKKYFRTLSRNSILIYIVPIKTLRIEGVRDLLSNLAELNIFRFPDEEFEIFNQILVIGKQKVITRKLLNENLAKLRDIIWQEKDEIPTTDEMGDFYPLPIHVPSSSGKNLVFKALRIDPQELLTLTSDLKTRFFNRTSPENFTDIHPLMPLRQGHLAMLLAAGYVNGELIQNGKHLIIKGAVKRVAEVSDESTETHNITKTKEKVKISVRSLDMNTEEIEEIE